MHKVGRMIAIIFASLLLVPLALAQPASGVRAKTISPMDNVIATLWAGKTFDQTAISPDGKQVAWVENAKEGSAIFISAISGGTPRRVTAGGQSESAIASSYRDAIPANHKPHGLMNGKKH